MRRMFWGLMGVIEKSRVSYEEKSSIWHLLEEIWPRVSTRGRWNCLRSRGQRGIEVLRKEWDMVCGPEWL